MKKAIRIIPAILTDDAGALEKMARLAEKFADYVQFDIMDGAFVPSRSVNCQQVASLKMKIKWEAHLMVNSPLDCLEDFHRAGADKIVFHYEAPPRPSEVITRIRQIGIKAGLAINPETPIAAVLPLVKMVDSVLFLSVNPGYYGSQFIPDVLQKIADFRRMQPDMEIGIDGGIKIDNIARIARSGVDTIYVGSAIFLQPDPAESYRRLKEAAAGAN